MIAAPYTTMSVLFVYLYRMHKKYQRMLDRTADSCDSLGPTSRS